MSCTSISLEEQNNCSKEKPHLLWGLVIAYLILFMARDIGGIQIPNICFSVFCSIVFCVLNIRQGFSFYLVTIITTVPFFEIRIAYILITVVKIVLLKPKFRIGSISTIIILLLLCIQVLDQGLYDKRGLYENLYLFTEISTILVVLIIWSANIYHKEDYYNSIILFLIGCLASAVSILYQSVSSLGWIVVINGGNRLGMDLMNQRSVMVTSMNTNALASLMVTSISLVLMLYSIKRIKWWMATIVFIFSTIITVMTQSRAGIVCFVLLGIYYYLFCSSNSWNIWRKAISLLVLIPILIIVLRCFPDLTQGIIDRFTESGDISNGRFSINSQCLEACSQSVMTILFGCGARIYISVMGLGTSAHNMFVDIIASWGIVGVILVLSWLGLWLKDSLNGVRKEQIPIAMLPAVIYFVGLQDGQFLTTETTLIIMFYLIIIIRLFKSPYPIDDCDLCH